MIRRREWIGGIALGGLSSAFSAHAQPTGLLDKSVRIVVGFPPGGSADLVARTLAQNLSSYAAQVIVDNKPGAGGRIAVESVKNAEADGAAILVTPSSVMSIYPHVYKKLAFDTNADFAPVAAVASFPFVLVVGPMVPETVKTLADFLSWAKTNSKQAAYASPGGGTTPHFVGAALAKASGVDLLHVPYKGGAAAMTDVMGGQIAANIAVISNALPHIQTGKVRALAVSGPTRSTSLPQVPTMAESGFSDVVLSEWFGVYLPRKASTDLQTRLHRAVTEAMRSKGMQDVLIKASFDPVKNMTPTEFSQFARIDFTRWGQIVKASGFTPED